MWRHLPNLLTFLRLLATPIAFYLIVNELLVEAFFIFIIAGFTDLVDGYLARRWHIQSRFGQIFDPIADKTLMLTCFVVLTFKGYIPLWVFYIMILRDGLILLGGLVVLMLKLPIKLKPTFISKVNTSLQIIYIAGTLIHFQLENLLDTNLDIVFKTLMWTTVATTLWSGLKYGIYFVSQLGLASRVTDK